MPRRTLLVVLMSLILTSAVFAGRLPGDYYNHFSLGYTTPHTAWASPLPGGKLKAYFIAPTHAAREVTELAQRLDLQVAGETALDSNNLGDPGTYGPYPGMVQGTALDEKQEAVVAGLQTPYDVYVLANFPVSKLPLEIQYWILRHVKEGAGLVLAYKRETPAQMWKHPLPEAGQFVSEVPLAGLTFYRTRFPQAAQTKTPGEIAGKLVQCYRFGKGRIVQLDYGIQSPADFAGGFCLTPHEPYTYRTLTEYDYHQALVAKALLWAAGREPAIQLPSLPAEGFSLVGGAPPQTLHLTAANTSGAPLALTLAVRVRNEWGEPEFAHTSAVQASAGGFPLEVKLPSLPGGTHFLDLQFSSARGCEGWASAALLVTAPTSLKEVQLDKLSFERGEPVKGVARLSAPCQSADFSLRVALLDNYDRQFAQKTFPIAAGASSQAFALPPDASVSLAGRVRTTLLRQRQPVDSREDECFICQRNEDYFPALIWGNLPGIFGHFTGVRLHEAGVNSVLHYYGEGYGEGRSPDSIAREDFHAIPYVTRIDWGNGRLGGIEQDEAFAKSLRDHTRASMPYDPLVYSLGDENYMDEAGGFSPNEHAAFVAFVKQRYPSVEALNQAWGTTYASLEDAQPLSSQEAVKQGQFVRYHDTESFREYLYARWHHYCQGVIKSVDPRARVGAEGSVSGDLEETIGGLEFWGPYREPYNNALLKSLAPRSLVRGNWFGGYNSGRGDLPGLPRFLWETVLDGSNLLELYCSYTCENFYNTDLTWAYWMDTFLPDVKELTEGLGQLLAHSDHLCDPVAIYQSQPSAHYDRLTGGFGPYEAAQNGAMRLCADLGYEPYYVTSRQVTAGVLKTSRPRVLLLPHATALSDAEVAEVERFVREGGLAVADIEPAVAGGDCSPRKQGALEGLLGVKRSQVAVQSAQAEVPGTKTQLTLDAALQAAGAQAVATPGGPVCLSQKAGQGATVLLNFSFSAYGPGPSGPLSPLYATLTGVLDSTGRRLQPRWRLTGADDQPLPGSRLSGFTRGSAEVLLALPPRPPRAEQPVAARLHGPGNLYLYDLRQGKYLGRAADLALSLKFTSATAVTALPYRVTALQVTAPARCQTGEACVVKLRLQAEGDAKAARPVFRVNAIGPEGRDRTYYARTRYAEGLTAQATIPFALSDPPGSWKIVARDVLTGTRATATVKLEGGR